MFATDADVCVAVTGIAGPDGGTEEKPVGLVYIATYMKDSVTVEHYQFKGDRAKVREQSVVKALDLLLPFHIRELQIKKIRITGGPVG